MRKIIVIVEMSLDGAIGGENMDFWRQVFPYHSQDVVTRLKDLLFEPDALLLGRKTYESFSMVWPTRKGDDADRINSLPKYVASKTLKEPFEWNAKLLTGDVAKEIQKLKQEPGGSLLQYGVGELTHTMVKHGLIDEFRVFVYPFTFKDGPRIFEHIGLNTLKLLDTKTFSSDVVELHYQSQKSA